MRCEECQGTGYIKIKDIPGLQYYVSSGMFYGQVPCGACNGTGIAHCCDGEVCNEAPPEKPKFKQYTSSSQKSIVRSVVREPL